MTLVAKYLFFCFYTSPKHLGSQRRSWRSTRLHSQVFQQLSCRRFFTWISFLLQTSFRWNKILLNCCLYSTLLDTIAVMTALFQRIAMPSYSFIEPTRGFMDFSNCPLNKHLLWRQQHKLEKTFLRKQYGLNKTTPISPNRKNRKNFSDVMA